MLDCCSHLKDVGNECCNLQLGYRCFHAALQRHQDTSLNSFYVCPSVSSQRIMQGPLCHLPECYQHTYCIKQS